MWFSMCVFSMSDVIQMLLLSRTKKIGGATPAEIVIINQPYVLMAQKVCENKWIKQQTNGFLYTLD